MDRVVVSNSIAFMLHSVTQPRGNREPLLLCASGEWGSWCDGQGGIRTHDTREGIPVFETGSFSHSDTCPQLRGKIRRERERKSVLTAYRLTVSPPVLRDLARSTMLINSCR